MSQKHVRTLAAESFTLERGKKENATCSRALFWLLLHTYISNIHEVIMSLLRRCRQWMSADCCDNTCATHPQEPARQLFFIPFCPLCWAGEEAKINKWWSNTVYANLISHASYVPPRFLWQQAAKIAGQVTSQRLNMSDFLCNDNAIEHTVRSSHKRGHINKKRFWS